MQQISPPSKQCLGETKYRYSREIKFLCAGPGHCSGLQSWPPYQDMTLLSTLLGKPGFQQQLHLLGPQEPGDLTCGKTIYWVTLSSHRGLRTVLGWVPGCSSMDQLGSSGVDL